MTRFVITGLIILGIFGYFWYAGNQDHQFSSVSEIWNSLQTDRETENYPRVGSAGFLSNDKNLSLGSGRQGSQQASIRIATFNMELTPEKLRDVSSLARLAEIIRQFDVVALQGLKSSNRKHLNQIMELVNHDGATFTYVLGPKSDLSSRAHQYGFVYNQASVILDADNVYAIDDPDQIFFHDPLVGWFMTRQAKQEQAFTFSLVNILIDPLNKRRELPMLENLYRAIRDDQRGEDDVILLGDLQTSDDGLKYLKRHARMDWIVKDQATDTRGQRQNSNILFYPPAVVEFTANGGVFDFLKELNLTMEEATQVSSQLPVWAEFQITEGSSPGRIAQQIPGVR